VTKTTVYYPVAGAMRVNGTLYYVLKDHLGSANVITDASGATIGEARYFPYGETRLTTGTMQTDQLFTGQRELAELGIYHYGARFYSPKLGRFLSADTIVPNAANPQDFNRYSYVRNNPIRYIDPTGHTPVCGFSYSDPECNNPDPWVPSAPYIPQPGGGGGGDDDPSPDLNPGGGGGGGPLLDQLITVVPDGPSCWDYATSCDASSGNYSLDLPGWHYYNTLNLVCPANLNCTADQMRDYLSRFSYPGQDPTNPVNNEQVNWVFAFIPLGQIRTNVSVDGLTIINTTQRNHLMYDGQVVRTAVQAPNGAWYIATTGTGNNDIISVVSTPITLAPLNQILGPDAFNNFDEDMMSYILANQ